MGHWLCRQEHVGRVQDAHVRPLVAVDSDHMPVLLVLRIEALRDDRLRRAYGEEVGEKMSLWCEAHPEATLDERAEAWRVVMMDVALDACGLRKRRDKDWFAANRDELMMMVAARNTARAAYSRSGGNLQLHGHLPRPRVAATVKDAHRAPELPYAAAARRQRVREKVRLGRLHRRLQCLCCRLRHQFRREGRGVPRWRRAAVAALPGGCSARPVAEWPLGDPWVPAEAEDHGRGGLARRRRESAH